MKYECTSGRIQKCFDKIVKIIQREVDMTTSKGTPLVNPSGPLTYNASHHRIGRRLALRVLLRPPCSWFSAQLLFLLVLEYTRELPRRWPSKCPCRWMQSKRSQRYKVSWARPNYSSWTQASHETKPSKPNTPSEPSRAKRRRTTSSAN